MPLGKFCTRRFVRDASIPAFSLSFPRWEASFSLSRGLHGLASRLRNGLSNSLVKTPTLIKMENNQVMLNHTDTILDEESSNLTYNR